MGFRRKVDENEELYTIPALAARPSIALVSSGLVAACKIP